MVKFKSILIALFFCFIYTIKSQAQFTDGMTGLLHMPNAEMQKQGTFMLGGNLLHYKQVPYIYTSKYHYNTFNYFLNFTIFPWLEVSYICTLTKGNPYNSYWPQQTWRKFVNQDRHFAGKIRLINEGTYWKYMPSIVIGVSDPTTGQSGNDYSNVSVGETGNGYFNCWYIALSKHLDFKFGEIGLHGSYLYNERKDNPLNGPALGINFRPSIHKNLNLIAEYDAKTINFGAIYSLWADHFNFLFELQDGKYVSCGLVYKVNLKGGNRWKSKIYEF